MFKFNSVGAAKQLLDNYYVDYFSPEISDEMQEKLAHKISIFTHIYLLQCKIDQNKDELEQMLYKNDDEKLGKRKEEEAATSKGKNKKAQTVYAQLSGQLSDLFQKAWQNEDELSLLCHLLELKNEIFMKLRLKIFGHCTKKPKCANALETQQTISENREQIAEWLLSDLLHYFPERQRLIGYFGEVSKRNNAEEILRTWKKFADLIGLQRVVMWTTFYEQMNTFENFKERKESRVKMKKIFLDSLMADWKSYHSSFWTLEKMIQEAIEFNSKKVKGYEFLNLKQIIADIQDTQSGGCGMKNSTMMLWEDAPDNVNRVLLFNALAICIKKAISEYDAKSVNTNLDKLKEFGEKTSQNMLKCMARLSSKRRQIKDEFLAKLYLDKIAKLIEKDAISGELEKALREKNEKSTKRTDKTPTTNKNKEKLAEKLDSEIHKNDEILWENREISEKNSEPNSERSENLDAFFALNLTDEMNESEGQQSNLNNESEWSSEKNSSEIWEQNFAEENAKKIRDEILGLKTEKNLWTETDQYRKGKSKKLKKIYKMEDKMGKSEEKNSSKKDKQNLNSNAETKGQTFKNLAQNSKKEPEIDNFEEKGQTINKKDEIYPNDCTKLMGQLRIYKIRERLIDSNIFGYLNGAALSVMAAKICVIHPNAPLIFLCQQFFALYSKWDWQNVPVLLEEVSPVSLNSLVKHWPPKVVAHSMTVITPKFPEQNATHTVNKNTREIIVEQLQIAHQILSLNVHNWRSIFDGIQIKEYFRHFAIIVCSSTVFNIYVTKCGFQKSKIRQNLLGWAKSEEVAKKVKRYQAITSFEQKMMCEDKNEASSSNSV
ncbi:hypothetical protein niasHT_006601 [Heterodera trifolii]|uniref:polynucleotide adenylyltransferase n=1 Tax=Heterodera trifolii TaxID=157864 RepID=A0ABD2M8X8_9BILA